MAVEMFPVESCPVDGDSWRKAGIALNCSKDTIGRNLYQCAPNEYKTDLVEFCLKGSIGRFDEGLCVYAYPSGHLGVKNCTTFVTGCPEASYTNNKIYNYPACLEINREAGCYLADPRCPPIDRTPVTLNKSSVSYKDGLGNVTLATTNFTNPTNSNPQDSVNVTAAVVSSLLVFVVVIGIILFFWCRRRIRRRRRRGYIEGLEPAPYESISINVEATRPLAGLQGRHDKYHRKAFRKDEEHLSVPRTIDSRFEMYMNGSRWETDTSGK